MDVRLERLLNWARGGKAAPVSIEFHPTNLCNCNCIMCGTRAEHRRLSAMDPGFDPLDNAKLELSATEALKLARESHELGIRNWLITGGGEPFFRKDLAIQLMQEIKRLGMHGNLNTNGVLLTTYDINRIIDMEWDMLMFSIDSFEPYVHDHIRGVKGTFEKANKSLLSFRDIKKKKGVTTPKIVFNSLLSNRICDKINEFLDYASHVGCADITFIPLITFDDNSRSLAMSEEQREYFQEAIDKYISHSEKVGVTTNLRSLKEKKVEDTARMDTIILSDVRTEEIKSDFSQVPCFEPFLNLVVKMNGFASPCCMLDNFDDCVKKKSLEEIWYGSYLNRLRESLREGHLAAGCNTCVFSAVTHNTELRAELRKNL